MTVTRDPRLLPAASLALVASGAALGAVLRWVPSVLWPSSGQEFVTTLLVTAAAAYVIGLLRYRSHRAGVGVFLRSAAGTAASLGLAAGFAATTQRPLWFAVYLAAFPVCVVVGLIAGSAHGIRLRCKATAGADSTT